MSAAWEWRSFYPGFDGIPLLDWAQAINSRAGLHLAGPMVVEQDTYLACQGIRHNFKLRSGALEVKKLVTRRRDGCSLWEDKLVWPFPLGPSIADSLRTLLPGRPVLIPTVIPTPAHLVHLLQTLYPDLVALTMIKHRIRTTGSRGERLELAEIELPSGLHLKSACVDGYELDPVLGLVRHAHLRPGGRVMSYLEMLAEAVWWYPALSREGAAVSERSPS